MVRPFPTRFPNSLISVVLLVPWLLICLACATTFPLDDLKKGMTAEAARVKFGEPEHTDARRWPKGAIDWSYTHKGRPLVLFFDEAKELDSWWLQPASARANQGGPVGWMPWDQFRNYPSKDAVHHLMGHTHHHGH